MATQARDPATGGTQGDRGAPRGLSPLLWSRLLQILAGQAGTDPVTVLDCGGGSGSLAVPLAARGARLTVLDISIDALSTMLRRAAEAGVSDQVTAVQGDVEALTEVLPSAQFDVVLAHGVLESVPQPGQAIRQIAALLRPGGVASLLVANPVAMVIGRLLTGDVSAALEGFHRSATSGYGLAAATSQCEAAGLILDSIEGIGVFTELVPGIELERPGALRSLAELEQAAAAVSPYREIASRLHVVARRPELDSTG